MKGLLSGLAMFFFLATLWMIVHNNEDYPVIVAGMIAASLCTWFAVGWRDSTSEESKPEK
jgi:hypothetical protein